MTGCYSRSSKPSPTPFRARSRDRDEAQGRIQHLRSLSCRLSISILCGGEADGFSGKTTKPQTQTSLEVVGVVVVTRAEQHACPSGNDEILPEPLVFSLLTAHFEAVKPGLMLTNTRGEALRSAPG